ncbi:MAG: enoyl-CoA hydratase/isomerase family protein [Promethearchaeota archaeon]
MNISDFQDILYEKEENGICTLIFNRPERRNAISKLTFVEIEAVLDDMEQDETAKVLIITGCKEAHAFSSGGYVSKDYTASIPRKIRKQLDFSDIVEKKLILKFWNFSKPIIVAINGLAIGVAATLPLAVADLIFMAEDAWLAYYFVKRAIMQESGTSFLLPFYVGFQKAKELLFFGDKVSAREAERIGLINKVLPSDELMAYAREQALRLIPPKSPSLSIQLMKKTIHYYFKDILSKIMDLENEHDMIVVNTEDFRESVRSLREKRDPIFIGK